MTEIRAATLEELKAVRQALEDLQRALPQQVKDQVATQAVPREELRRRLRRNFWRTLLVTVAIVALVVGVNRVTLIQSRGDLTEQITTCFLRPSQIAPAQVAACDRRFGNDDHTYLKLQEQSRQAAATFVRLQQRVARLEAEVGKLRE